jgi:hypothetical protein
VLIFKLAVDRDTHLDVRLVTGAFAVLQNDPSIGRAEALRRAEMTMLDPDRPRAFSHALFVALPCLGTRRCPGIAIDGIVHRLAVAAGCSPRCRKSRLDFT